MQWLTHGLPNDDIIKSAVLFMRCSPRKLASAFMLSWSPMQSLHCSYEGPRHSIQASPSVTTHAATHPTTTAPHLTQSQASQPEWATITQKKLRIWSYCTVVMADVTKNMYTWMDHRSSYECRQYYPLWHLHLSDLPQVSLAQLQNCEVNNSIT